MNYKINKGFEKFTPLLESIQTHFNLVDETIHKARNELKVLNYENTDVVVKSFKIPHLINRIVYTFSNLQKPKNHMNMHFALETLLQNLLDILSFSLLDF